MNKKELTERIVDLLHDNDVRKNVAAQKTTLHISDDHGNGSDFIIRRSERGLLYTKKDVSAILEACLLVVEDAIKHGEDVSIHGFGTLGVHQRAARATLHPSSGEPVQVSARYVPKFNFGNTLRLAAKVYEMSLAEERADE